MGLTRAKSNQINKGDIALIGIPFDDHSSFMKGPAKAPELIIDAIESDSSNFFTESISDLNQHPRIKWCGNIQINEYREDIEKGVETILDRGGLPFSLGGDHSISFPILKAIFKKYGQVSILHFDAHNDLYDSLDGNQFSHACPFARILEEGLASSLTQVGIRTMNEHQKNQAERFGVEVIDMKNWDPAHIFNLKGPVYLSFDMDVLDPAFAPGVSHHEPGGFSTRQALTIIQNLDIEIIGVDLVEYNPERDIQGMTAMVAGKIIKEIIDQILRKYYMNTKT